MLLEIGGLIEKEGKKWHTVVPILDKSQTDGLRAYSKQVADKVYTIAKSDFQLLMKEIDKMGFKDNTASLIFSYLLDGQMDFGLGLCIPELLHTVKSLLSK